MRPVTFNGYNTTFGKDQPEYLPLPAHTGKRGRVTTCWRLTMVERFKLLFTGHLWLQQLTFGAHLQPQKVSIEKPVLRDVL